MDTKAWIAAPCLILLVVVINFSLVLAYRRRHSPNQVFSISDVFNKVKKSIINGETEYQELSRRVSNLPSSPSTDPEEETPPR